LNFEIESRSCYYQSVGPPNCFGEKQGTSPRNVLDNRRRRAEPARLWLSIRGGV